MLPQGLRGLQGLPEVDAVDVNASGKTSWPAVSPEVDVDLFEESPSLSLPQAWKAVPIDFGKNASRARLREWLGPQAWKLDRNLDVQLIEVFAGRARLSDEFEAAGGISIRIGRAWGQELRGDEARWLLRSLVSLVGPAHVFISFPCKAHCKWNQFNIYRSLETRQKILRECLDSKSDLDLVFEMIESQSSCGRHVTLENPSGSLAWKDSCFSRLRVPHYFTTFHKCALGLRRLRSGLPVRKSAVVFTTRHRMADYMCKFRCRCSCGHDHVEGA